MVGDSVPLAPTISFGPNALFILGSPFTYIFLFAWSGYQTKATSTLNISTRPGQEF